MDPQVKKSLKQAWQAQIRQVAARHPKLAQTIWQNRQGYFARFAHFYQQLANLPRKFRHKFLKRLASTLAGAALLLALGQALPARAAVITVDGVICTLAEALESANSDNAAGNGCVDGNGADVIDLQVDVTLSAPLPFITSEITLEGNGHIISGDNNIRVLNVQATGDLTLSDANVTDGYSAVSGSGIFNAGTLTINDSTLSDNTTANTLGVGGGGIFNMGTLILNNSILKSNSAPIGGGIWNSNGIVIVNDSTIANNSAISGNFTAHGGGIANSFSGKLTVNNSFINNNFSNSLGGGIYNGGFTGSAMLTLNNSTLDSNEASGSGGGIWNDLSDTVAVNSSTLVENLASGSGGGIMNFGTLIVSNSTLNGNFAIDGGGGGIWNEYVGTVAVNNSTISGNTANDNGGGIVNYGGVVSVTNSTLVNNIAAKGGGNYNNIYGTLSINHILASGNSASTGAEVYNLGTINANNFNVIGYGGSSRSFGFTPSPNDIIPPGSLNTILEPTLADNGGPTFTHALVSGSVAIDIALDEACLVAPLNGLDQRGFDRNVDGDGVPSSNECDAGAFEYASSITPTLTPTSTPTVTSLPGMTSTPRSSPTPTGHPTWTATPRLSPTPTRTPQSPTQIPDPRTPTRTPTPVSLLLNERHNPLVASASPLVGLLNLTLLALGNILWFRKRRI